MTNLLRFLLLALIGWVGVHAAEPDANALVVIAHATVTRVDTPTLQRLYTGRAIEVAGTPVNPVNLSAGHPLRERFMAQVLNEDNDKYVAYWTVRRHIGKGIPPREFKSAAEVIEYVQATPGGLGYIAASDLKPGLNVIARP